jgi:hypothetical protein
LLVCVRSQAHMHCTGVPRILPLGSASTDRAPSKADASAGFVVGELRRAQTNRRERLQSFGVLRSTQTVWWG